MDTDEYADTLRGAGLRVTAPRLATLAVVTETQHMDADSIAAAVRERLGTVSTQAVYDVLRALTDADIVRRVSPDGRGARFEVKRHDNHHHLLCTRCGRLEDVACATGVVPCLTPPGELSVRIDSAEVLYRGLCTECTRLDEGSVETV